MVSLRVRVRVNVRDTARVRDSVRVKTSVRVRVGKFGSPMGFHTTQPQSLQPAC